MYSLDISLISEKEYFLWLSRVEGIGIKKIVELVKRLGSAKAIFNANEFTLKSITILNDVDIKNIIKNQDINLLISYIKLNNKHNVKFVTIYDDDYPFLLKQISSPPPVIYYKGYIPNFETHIPIGIIGARNCSPYGRTVTKEYSSELAKNNVIIVSGLASGIDGVAHEATLDANGLTIAVLGSGVEICYPSENLELYNRIIETGCIMSEYPPETKMIKSNFPQRNRIIAGLCHGLVVVESRARSGTQITVNFALEEGRDVFAVPGNVTSKLSEGTNMLISDGAICASSPKVIMSAYNLSLEGYKTNTIEKKNTDNLTKLEKELYSLIISSEEGKLQEQLISSFNIDNSEIIYNLLNLEIKGYIQKVAGNRYTKK